MQDHVRDRLMAWMGAVLCLALLLPNHYSPWLTFHQELVTAIAFLPALLWSCFRRHTPPALACGAGILAIVPVVQVATGHLYFAGDGWLSMLYLLAFALAIHAGAWLVQPTTSGNEPRLGSLSALWVGLVIAGFISVAIALHQWLWLGKLTIFIVDMPPNGRPFANFAQPNQLATLLLLAIAGLAFLFESGKARAMATSAGVLVLVFGLVMTGSRSVLLTLIWLIPAYAFFRRQSRVRTTPAVLALVVGLYVLGTLGWHALNNALLLGADASPGTVVDRLSDPGTRKLYWLSMLDAITRAPWAGYGWGQVGLAQSATALEYPPVREFFESSHNLLLDLALSQGLPVTLVVVTGLGLWFTCQIRKCSSPQAWVTLVAIGMVLSHAMVEYPLNYAYFLLPVGLFMGALSAVTPTSADQWLQRTFRRGIGALPLAGVAGTLLFAAVVVEYLPYEENWRLLRFQEARIGDPTPTQAPPAMFLTNIHELLRLSRAEARLHMTKEEVEAMRRVSQRYAYPSLMYRYAVAQGLNGDPHGARLTLERLCKMHSEATCADAGRTWARMGRERFPQLATVPLTQP